MTKSQWFWKYGYILIIPIGLLYFWVSGSEERKNQSHVNPEVFQLFKQIETKCNAEPFNDQSQGCTDIYLHKKECKKVTVKCNSRTYYDFLVSEGHVFPPYYEHGFKP